MHTYDAVRTAADHLRAQAEVSRSQPALLLTLLLAALASALGEDQAGWLWAGSLIAGVLLLPRLLRRILPRGNLFTFRLSFVAYPAQAFLLGFIAFLELSKLPPLDLEELPRLDGLVPALAVVVALAYLVQLFPRWRRLLRQYGHTVAALKDPGDAEALAEVRDLAERALAPHASTAAPWAEFRTLPALPRSGRRFLRLDLELHGHWRVMFAQDYALVIARDGTGLEAVPRKGLRIAAEDPNPGGKPFLCLVRWNEHLHEGRIREGSLKLIESWNLKTVPVRTQEDSARPGQGASGEARPG